MRSIIQTYPMSPIPHVQPPRNASLAMGISNASRALTLLSLTTSLASAASLDVPNGSFESPKPPQGFPASPFIDVWQKSPQPQGIPLPSGISWDQLSGVFPNTAIGNSDHIDNMDGSQAAYIFAIPGVSLSQSLSAQFEVGQAYQMSLGILGGGGITEGSTFAFSLFFRDSNNNPVTLASTSVSYSASTFPNATHLIDYSLIVPAIQPTDPAAGKNIGVQLTSTFGTGAGYWDVDNVRVAAVPEPTTLALLLVGSAALLARRSRPTQ